MTVAELDYAAYSSIRDKSSAELGSLLLKGWVFAYEVFNLDYDR
jgi:hypothetical protein